MWLRPVPLLSGNWEKHKSKPFLQLYYLFNPLIQYFKSKKRPSHQRPGRFLIIRLIIIFLLFSGRI